ncbi:HNH endonuclease signature motif containing protein [Pseudoponticoccus marisrubri]|uniref:HNH endonuclease signature motif containing protein n=1 Tax=Pseudoponticoccus marisrubri TaxID=1685382 RepID=UPI000A032BF0|nr:HNH endonuclease signature motif containing protein [Pseudoponticoccus marisrubri]
MPRPPRLCSCGRTVAHGTLCTCQRDTKRARDKRHDAHRPSAARRGYSSAWRKARAAFLTLYPICAHPGCTAPATVVDHIIPHRGDHALFWDRSNWQPLCQRHHDADKQRQERSE